MERPSTQLPAGGKRPRGTVLQQGHCSSPRVNENQLPGGKTGAVALLPEEGLAAENGEVRQQPEGCPGPFMFQKKFTAPEFDRIPGATDGQERMAAGRRTQGPTGT